MTEKESKTPLDKFLETAPPIDDVREEAARCAEETARYIRGERGEVRTPDRYTVAEFSAAACGTAAEVALIVGDALKQAGATCTSDFCWKTAAAMLRNGWQRGHRLVPHIVGKEPAS